MRCSDIQKYFVHLTHREVDAQFTQLPAKVRAHLLECPNCRQAQAVYAEIDAKLREQPAWQPPPGFAERVSLQGLASLSKAPARPQGFHGRIFGSLGPAVAHSLPPILLGLLGAMFCLLVLLNANALVTGYPDLIAEFSKALLANAIPLAWTTGIVSLCFSAWVTQRSLR
jgi:hypothetical protein